MLHLREVGLLALLLAVSPAQSEPPAPHPREVLQALDCQLELPVDPARNDVTSGEAANAPRAGGPRAARERRVELAKTLSGGWCGLDFAQVLLWIAVAVAVLLLVAAIVGGRGGSREQAPKVLEVHGATPAVLPPPPLPDHALLAQNGDYLGALRAVLQRAVTAWVDGGGKAPSHATARALLNRVRSSGARAEPFGALVLTLEAVQFAGVPADAGRYAAAIEQLASWEAACRPQP
jgi:hypothetical protein